LGTLALRRPPPPLPARNERAFAAPPVARFVSVKAVGSFVPALTRKSFEKFGFSTATLIMDWTGIVGGEIAGYTVPERLKWPRGAGGDTEEGESRPGATLLLRVDPARALDVEYRARQIIDRINAYFGYRAVETIRLVQAPLDAGRSLAASPVASNSARGGEPAPADPLDAALARLGQGVRRATTPAAKR